MRKAIVWLIFCGCVLNGTSSFAQFRYRGGLTYYTTSSYLCPGYNLQRPAPDTFQMVFRKDVICAEPRQTGQTTFVLGALTAFEYRIFLETDLGNTDQFILRPLTNTGQTISAASINASGSTTFHITVLDGIKYTVQRSVDFKNWVDVTELTGESDFVDPQTPVDVSAFYRIKIPEVQAGAVPSP